MIDLMLEHWFLTILFVLGLLVWGLFKLHNKILGYREVGVTEAVQLMNQEDCLVIDVRDQHEFEGGHIIRAKSRPLERLQVSLQSGEGNEKTAIIFVYCDNGQRSAKAAALFFQSGYQRTAKLKGGLISWRESGLPLEETIETTDNEIA